MKATHWSHSDDPEQWMDDPCPKPEDAAELFLIEDEDGGWEARHELIQEGTCRITVFGYRETNDPLPEDSQFDGYEPGCTYFAPTGEELVVEVRRMMSVKESNPKDQLAGASPAQLRPVVGRQSEDV